MSKRNRIIYWVATVWLSLGMVATGVQQLMHLPIEEALAPPGTHGMAALGYPAYLLTLLGIWKLLGVVVLFLPRTAMQKEWAYAGFFFLLTGALFSHIAVGHGAAELFPAGLLLVMLVLSWSLRPADRKTNATGQ
jgi:hypothetical protein